MTNFYHSGGSGHGPVGPRGTQGVKGDVGPGVINWTGVWSNTQPYALNDAVAYAGSSYICIDPHTGSEPPSAKWAVLASKGDDGPIGPQGEIGATGPQGEIGVTGSKGDTGATGPQGVPGSQGQNGQRGLQGVAGAAGSPGLVWRGDWNETTWYVAPDVVQHDGSAYVCLAPSYDSAPPSDEWALLAARGEQGQPGP